VEKKHGEKGKGEGEGGEAGQLKAIDPFIVNLNDDQGSRYLKAVMQFEVSHPAVDQEITEKTPQIRDEILMLLSNKSYDDIATVSGKRVLKREIIGSVNRFLKTGQVTQIYFSEFVVQ
jgi:flagellar FliL protein